MDEQQNQNPTNTLAEQTTINDNTLSTQITNDADNNQSNKKKITLSIIFSILIAVLIIFPTIQFISIGGFDGIKARKTWEQIEYFLNQHTNDNFNVISQNSDMIKISFDDTGRIDFSCWEPSIFNMGISGLRCSFKFYYNNTTTDRIGRYYLLKHSQEVDELIENYPDLSNVDKRFNDYRRISFNLDNEEQLKLFFYKLLEIEDYKNTWLIYKDIVAANGKIEETQSVKEDNPINILDPNSIYLDIKTHNYYDHVLSDYESLFDYAYEHNW